jgi:hypothetical protein
MKVQEDRKQETPSTPLKSEPIRGHEQSTSTTGRNSPWRGAADEGGGGPRDGGVAEHSRGVGFKGHKAMDAKGRKASRAKGHKVTEMKGHEMGAQGEVESNLVSDARNGGGAAKMGLERGVLSGREVEEGVLAGRSEHSGDVRGEMAGGKVRQVVGTAASSAVTATAERRKGAKSSLSSSSTGAAVIPASGTRTAPMAGHSATATTTSTTRRRVSRASIDSGTKHASQVVTPIAKDGGFFISNTAV